LSVFGFGTLASLLFATNVIAEPYVGFSLGWTFDKKLTGISGDENLNYPLSIDTTNGTYYPGTKYSDIQLKDVLKGGIKAGYYFESAPNFGIELEANYSQPNMKQQNVSLTNASGTGPTAGVGIGDAIGSSTGFPPNNSNQATEDQLPAKVRLLQFNVNALYRYREFKDFTPYIGGGPSLNIIRITGTGESGHFVDPIDPTLSNVVPASSVGEVSDTSVNLGLNFKVGGEYKLDVQWGLGAEYHYNWVPIDISHFRSANNLSADLKTQSLSINLTRHF
jgi:opacity protein-like surface antigen